MRWKFNMCHSFLLNKHDLGLSTIRLYLILSPGIFTLVKTKSLQQTTDQALFRIALRLFLNPSYGIKGFILLGSMHFLPVGLIFFQKRLT